MLFYSAPVFEVYIVAAFSIAGCCTSRLVAVVECTPVCIRSIFLLSSCAREKVMSTSTKRKTTIFFSDKICFITGNTLQNSS